MRPMIVNCRRIWHAAGYESTGNFQLSLRLNNNLNEAIITSCTRRKTNLQRVRQVDDLKLVFEYLITLSVDHQDVNAWLLSTQIDLTEIAR